MITEFIFGLMILILIIKIFFIKKFIKKQDIDIYHLKKEHLSLLLNNDTLTKRIDDIDKFITKNMNDIKTDLNLISDAILTENNIKFDEEELA